MLGLEYSLSLRLLRNLISLDFTRRICRDFRGSDILSRIAYIRQGGE